jgi:hypothetical protein
MPLTVDRVEAARRSRWDRTKLGVRTVASSGWLPAGLVGVLSAVTLYQSGVAVAELVTFAAYALGAVVVPGTLVWRAARGGPSDLVTDVAAGTAVGYALEVAAYLPARAAGAPLLALALPAGIVVAFVAVPGLRRFWRGSGERVPAWWAWLVSLLAAFLLAWAVGTFFPNHGLTWPANASPYLDMPYQLALAGEIKHHLPPVVPYVDGPPLKYHWFVHAELAATSWGTGIELQTLLYRLSLLPMQAAFVALIAVAGRRLVGLWWAGPVAAAVALFAVIPNPYRWLTAPATEGNLLAAIWLSPTQTFGALLFVPVVVVLVELLRGDAAPGRAGRWALLALLLTVLAGAKATFLPIALGALLAVAAGQWLLTRTVNTAALAGAGMTAAALALAQLVLFRGSSAGLRVAPLQTIRESPFAERTDLATSDVLLAGSVAGLVLCLVFWALAWPGAFGLLARPRRLADPAYLLCLGIAGAAFGAVVVFFHLGGGQAYFLQSARPYLGILVAGGLAAVLPAAWFRSKPLGVLLAALAGGAVTILLLWAAGSGSPPSRGAEGGVAVLAAVLLLPMAVLVGVAVLAGLAVRVAARRAAALRGLSVAVVLVFLTGAAVPGSIVRFGPGVYVALTRGVAVRVKPPAQEQLLDEGAVQSARWLRDHSAPDDLVATNAHCRVPQQKTCDSRHFWIAAYAERRVLVEGWDYTDRTYEAARRLDVPHWLAPFWDPALLADNDRAFREPSAATVGRLRDAYGVRWLFVDRRAGVPPATLARFATPRFRAGDIEIYEL